MATEDPPANESDARPTPASDDAGSGMEPGPAVGNVLGFSLLFRERRALLALTRRSLATGVRLREYEAVLPGVRFPLRGPLNATKFRNRRPRVVASTLAIEDRALLPWLRERLVGAQLLGVQIDTVELELRRDLPEAARPRPCLMIRGQTAAHEQIWLLTAFDILPEHRLLVLRPCRLWLVGQLPERKPSEREPSGYAQHPQDASIDREGRDSSARRLWRAIARRLASGSIAGVHTGIALAAGDALSVDPVRLALTRAFARVGWKAPNLEGCAIETLNLNRRGLTLEIRGPLTEAEPGEEGEEPADTDPPEDDGRLRLALDPRPSEAALQAIAPGEDEPGLLEEAIGRQLDQARDQLRAIRVSGEPAGPTLELLASLSRELQEFPAAHLALVRWRVSLSRFLDRPACLEAAREWLDLQPSATEPRQLTAVLLAAEDRVQDLARLLAAECRQPNPPLTQARLELAVANLLIDRLDDARSALALVGPLTQRLREQIETARDRRARPRADQDEGAAQRQLAALEATLPEALVVLARARVAEVAREGRSLATVPHVLGALEEALEGTYNPRRRADLRARVAASFARYGAEHGDDRRGDAQALTLLEAAIADDPDSVTLIDDAIELALRSEARGAATKLLTRRLELAAAHERPSLRKRLIAVAAELDDPDHQQLARRELGRALELEPDNAALLRRASVLERKLGDALAAAEYIGRLLELDEHAEIELDDRDVLVLERARLLHRASRIDQAWDSLRPALALIPSQARTDPAGEDGPDRPDLRWVLDVLELALELAPPTDRPRILDLLITHATGQRRGEALVERAAQALRVDERLRDLWAAIEELEQPRKVLAQIEQLLDDRDYEGLSRLAEVSRREDERTTELHARARLGQALLAEGDSDNAQAQLERALELGPDRLALRRALAQAYAQTGREQAEIPLLQGLLEDDLDASPDARGRMSLRLAELLRLAGQPEQAAEVLARCERELSKAPPASVSEDIREAVADQSFAALRELAEDDRALTVALEQAAALWTEANPTGNSAGNTAGSGNPNAARRLGAWLAHAARVLDEAGVEEVGELSQLLGSRIELPDELPRTRVALLETAVELRPDDAELADGLEAVLRELGDQPALESHLRRQLDRNADPQLREVLLERLIDTLEGGPEASDPHELAELLEDLLVLRPGHTAAMLALGRLRHEAEQHEQARQLWAMIVDRIAEDDPRFYRPALELAAAALDDHDGEAARTLATRAHRLAPDELEPLLVLTRVAAVLDAPVLAAEVLGRRLDLDERAEVPLGPVERAELELARAEALSQQFEREGDPQAAAGAMSHYATAEQLLPSRERGPERSSATRRWLGFALELDDADQQARARAVLRETIGDELETPELIAEIELLDPRLERPLAALELVEGALIQREADPALLASFAGILERHVEEFELAARGQRILRAALRELEPGAPRVAVAELLVAHARRLDDPTTVLFGLDQLDTERVEQGELAQIREWAIRKLGRVQEEVGSLESRLASGGLAHSRRATLVTRLLALHDGQVELAAQRLLELAEQAEREVAAALADAALELLEAHTLALAHAPETPAETLAGALALSLRGLRSLVRHAGVERGHARWPTLDEALTLGLARDVGLELLADFVELAGTAAHTQLSERAHALLAKHLPLQPSNPHLQRALWALAAAVVLREGEPGPPRLIAEAANWLDRLIRDQSIAAPLSADLFDALAEHISEQVDPAAAAAMLRDQAALRFDDDASFTALLHKLETRRCWPELLTLLNQAAQLERELGRDPDAWLALAEAAGEDDDQASELRARERAGELLGDAAGLLSDPPLAREHIDEAVAERAITQLRRALQLAPEHALLRWRLGLALARLGLIRPAFEHLVVLWEREQWSAAGVELGELALRCGELASELDEHERAVELLSVAHTRVGDDWREYTTEALFTALLAIEDRDTAVTLAGTRAAELQDKQASVRWLRRAAELAEGPRKVDLLVRARELDPSDDNLIVQLEHELRELDDREALEALLRERIARYMAANESLAGDAPAPELLEPWVATLENLIELLESELELDAEDDDSEQALVRTSSHVVALYEELLALVPEHRVALMTVATDHYRNERQAEALALWSRAEPTLPDDDPRLFDVARHLAQRAVTRAEFASAHRLLERALSQRPHDLDTLSRQHEVACALDDPARVLAASQALLGHPGQTLPNHRLAELHGDIARAQILLEDSQAALATIEQAVELADRGSELQRDLVTRWLELLEHPSLAASSADLDATRLANQRELDARAQLRRALGAGLERGQALRELDLLLALDHGERAAEQLEQLLIAEPTAEDLRARLQGLDPETQELGERGLRSLRRVVETIGAGPARDDLARTLALAGREADAARTTLDALDRLSGTAAATPELLDLRVWALRQLDRVEDELSELDALLSLAGGGEERDRVVLDRLMRVLEHDAAACIERLLELAGVNAKDPEELPAPRTRAWLLESALSLVETHLPERVELGVRALTPLLEIVGDPEQLMELDGDELSARSRIAGLRRGWQQLAARALNHANRDRRTLDQVQALIRVADAAADSALPGFTELGATLLDRATVDFPDHVGLHELARERSNGDPGEALDRIEGLADAHRMDPRGRARLYLGLAATLSDESADLNPGDSGIYEVVGIGDSPRTPRRKFLRDIAGYHAGESAIFSPLREALRKLGAFTEMLALLDTVDADAEQWLELAEDAAAGEDTGAEASARRRAGLALYERILAEEREGGGLADSSLERACVQLGRALELGANDPSTQYHYGRALERAGQKQAAFAQLEPLVKGPLHKKARVELGPLARRCGLLAIEIGQRERAAALLHLAYASLVKTRTRIGVAERLFELLQELAAATQAQAARSWTEQASDLAREVAELIESEQASAPEASRGGPDPLPWLERAARLAADESERARLYAHAHELAPDDGRLADLYEASLRELGRNEELERLLRARISTDLQSGDRARTVAQLERLLALLAERDPSPSSANEFDAERVRERAELLEQLLRLAPDRLEARLELADLRLQEGDREAAAVHWRALAQRLPTDDHRFLAPARALAQFAIESEDLDQARSWLERSLRIEPDDAHSLDQLLDVGRGLDLPELVLSTSETLLARADADPNEASVLRSRAALLRERASAYERLAQHDKALTEIRAAASVSVPGSDDHVEAARQWLRLATRDATRVLLRQEEAVVQAQLEVEARSELRAALGEALPARAYAAEAEALSDRLERRDDAIELLLEGLRHHVSDPDLLATFEELCAISGQQARFVRSLAELLQRVPQAEQSTRIRLGEKLARAGRAIADHRACLDALEALPEDVSERPELLELRDWAVRGLGNVDDELARLDARVLASAGGTAPERLQALVTRMLRLCGDAGEPTARRLLGLANGDAVDPELRRALSRTALRVAREYAPERLEVALETLHATLATDTLKAITAWWPGIESLALEARKLPALLELLEVSISAEHAGGSGYGEHADRLAAAAARLDSGDASLHVQLLRRAKLVVLAPPNEPLPEPLPEDAESSMGPTNEPEQLGLTPDPPLVAEDWEQVDAILDHFFASLNALVTGLDLRGDDLAQLWSSAMTLLEVEFDEEVAPQIPMRISIALRERTVAQVDDRETYAALLLLLRQRDCLADVVDLLLWADERYHDLDLEVLDQLAQEAGAAGDEVTRRRARIELGVRRAKAGKFLAASESFAEAHEVAEEGWTRDVLQYLYGEMLARAGRSDAALEQLLPLVNKPELDELMNVIAEHLGIDQRIWAQRLDKVALARRCAELLARVDARERAATLFDQAFEASEEGDPRRVELAEQRFEILVRLGMQEAAAALATTLAGESGEHPERRVVWLLRVAEYGDERSKIDALADAHALRPTDELAERLERELEMFGEDQRLAALLRTRIEQSRIALTSQHANQGMREQARERGADALRKLIELHRSEVAPEPGTEPSPEVSAQLDATVAKLYIKLLEFVPDDVDAQLELAASHERGGRIAQAVPLWRRAGELLPAEDDRFFAPALRLAKSELDAARFETALALLERASTIRPGELEVLELQRELAIASDDLELRVRTLEALLEQPKRAADRTTFEFEAAGAHALLAERRASAGNDDASSESLAAAIAAFERAADSAPEASPLHAEIARAWLAVVATDFPELVGPDGLSDETDPRGPEVLRSAREREVDARAHLRAALAQQLSPLELRTEASLLALGLGRIDEGLSLVEDALLADPGDPLLLSSYKDLCLASGAQTRYADALDAAIGALQEGPNKAETRDRLATELAFTAIELDDAPRLLAQVDRMTPARANSPELLDLREWAIRKLDRVEDELTEIDQELLASATKDETANLVDRLLRMLEQDFDGAGRRLVMLASRAEAPVAVRLRGAALEMARNASPSYFDVLLNALEQILDDHDNASADTQSDRESLQALPTHWPAIEKIALERDDPGMLAMLLDLGQRAVKHDLVDLRERVDDLRDLSLIRHPDSPELHALVLGPLEVSLADLDRDLRLERADQGVADLAAKLGLEGRKRALLWVGFAKLFDRREAAALLSRRARSEHEDDAVFLALVDALEHDNHWTRSLELLEFRVAREYDSVRRVADLKHLAHLCADILGDPDAAIAHLQAALVHAPEDPDLMLPLLDHYYAQPQLDRAIELSSRVLEHVPMGAVAFAALGHRAADAALATGEHPLAEQLLRTILTRVPDDARTRDRLRELEQLADDPEHRVRMLAAIANRTTSSARVEALEERARLLIAPLGRLEEAIADLEAVTSEAPGRHAAVATLSDLYEQRQRWPALVNLLEREYPRRQGLERVLTLERIAIIQRERLDESARAEKALRLGLENLDGLGVDRLAAQLEQRPALRAELTHFSPQAAPEPDEDFEADADALFESIVQAKKRDPTGANEAASEAASARANKPQAPDIHHAEGPLDLDLARRAWAQLADRLHLQIVSCLEQQGRFSELIAHLELELRGELRGELDPRERFPEAPIDFNLRLLLMQRLARALRDHVDDGERTASVYIRLEQLDALPDEGLATLARWYRGQQRYDDLVRILTVRSRKLAALDDWDRKAEADYRIGELLEGPLRRPHEAARFFLDAYLANPLDNPSAGSRARVLLGGTDSVVNVRNRLLRRLENLREDYKPALLTLLADLLSPHDDHEDEAEKRYRQALSHAPELATALEGLGRLLSRRGRLEDAIEPLRKAAQSPDIPDERAADDAAAAARALIELARMNEAEQVLKEALERAPESQRALLELARLYDRLDRKTDEATILDRLAGLSLSSMLRAEVGYRQAMLLAKEFRTDPMSEAGEKARALLLEAVGADAMHAQARHILLELAGARSEWSIVAHMHFLAIRELPPGPRRALTHLDLAETYLDRLSDAQSAVRNLGAALQQAPMDVVVSKRASNLAARLPEPGDAAGKLEQLSKIPGRPEGGEKIDDASRARLLLVASELHLRNDTLEPAEAAARAATKLDKLPDELRKIVERALEQIVQIDQGEFDLRKRRKSLHNKLEASEDPVERMQVFMRLRETAQALEDRDDLQEITRRQVEFAHELLEGDSGPAREVAVEALRDVFAESGDYAKIVQLYEDLAGRAGEGTEAAELLSSAARFAWSGLRDPRLAVAIVRRALDRAPTHAPATELLGEIAGASDEREVDATICDELSQLAPRQRPPLLTLRLAEAALRLERREHAQTVLRQLLAGEAPVELRLQALSLLDGLLDSDGRTHDRIPLLEERLELCRRHWPDRAADVALELARAQRAVGNLQDARATCRTALLDKPSDQPLTKLYAELLEQAEDWTALARALEQLANLTIETREQAHWLTRAAQVHLDHGNDGRESFTAARRLLERARAISMESTESRALLLPLSFHQGDWERVLELAIELRSIAGDEHEALIYAALTEAFSRGKRTLARSIADRHERPVRQRILWPVCARMLEQIATEGPLPRLDALLAAAAALCGGTEELLDELGAWAAGQPLQAGLALGLARLNEAFRRMQLARHLYQIAAFMAPGGPVPVLTTRLPAGELPRAPMSEDNWIPLEWRGALREVMLELRETLAGVRGQLGSSRPPRTPKERLAVRHADRIVNSWRVGLGVELTIAVTEQKLSAGIGVRNLAKPTIVVSEQLVDVPETERRYRLAYAAAALSTGLAIVFDDDPMGIPDLLDALTTLVKPRHEPTTDAARGLVDTLAARGMTASKLDSDLRRSLARELDHWRNTPVKLERVLHRACLLFATRLSGNVDGALTAMARDRGLMTDVGKPGDPAVLETTDAAWLLRALGVFGGHM